MINIMGESEDMMSGFCEVEINRQIFIWGSGARVSPLLQQLPSKIPICWAYHQQQSIPVGFVGQTIWGSELQKLGGNYGQFTCQLTNGSVIEAGAVAVFADATPRDEPVITAGQSVALLLSGTGRGIFAHALAVALRLANQHQVYLITDDVQVAYSGGEDLFTEARAAGVVFFRTSEWTLSELGDQGFEIWLPQQNLQVQVDQVVDYRQDIAGTDRTPDLGLGPMSVSGVLNTRREGVYLFPASYEVAPAEERLLYQALAARLLASVRGHILDYQGMKIDSSHCALCLTCYRICPHRAINLVPTTQTGNLYHLAASINPAACQGCGTCYAACPANAIRWDEAPLNNSIILACENSGFNSELRPTISVRQYPCAQAISNADILHTLANQGQVVIYACREGSCRHQGCAPELDIRLKRLQEQLLELGVTAEIKLIRKSVAEIGNHWGEVSAN
ncbi:MAG: 4Fe-4S binding protein [Methylocystaceae bacterium]